MGLLDGGGAAFMQAAFNGILLPGTVYSTLTVYDRYGEPSTVTNETPCRIQIDRMSEAMRSAEGAAESDRSAIVMKADVNTDCKLSANAGPYGGTRWLVMSAESDPVGSHWVCRVRRDPTA